MTTATESDESVVAAVLAAEEGRLAAIHAADWTKLADYLGDDLTYTHMGGQFENKQENIANLGARPRRYVREDLSVRSFGDVAVMNGMLHVTILARPDDGTEESVLHGRVVQVWALRDGRWQMVAFQATTHPT